MLLGKEGARASRRAGQYLGCSEPPLPLGVNAGTWDAPRYPGSRALEVTVAMNRRSRVTPVKERETTKPLGVNDASALPPGEPNSQTCTPPRSDLDPLVRGSSPHRPQLRWPGMTEARHADRYQMRMLGQSAPTSARTRTGSPATSSAGGIIAPIGYSSATGCGTT